VSEAATYRQAAELTETQFTKSSSSVVVLGASMSRATFAVNDLVDAITPKGSGPRVTETPKPKRIWPAVEHPDAKPLRDRKRALARKRK
jgi:hypothetical protein